jgi:hypothetical protein
MTVLRPTLDLVTGCSVPLDVAESGMSSAASITRVAWDPAVLMTRVRATRLLGRGSISKANFGPPAPSSSVARQELGFARNSFAIQEGAVAAAQITELEPGRITRLDPDDGVFSADRVVAQRVE